MNGQELSVPGAVPYTPRLALRELTCAPYRVSAASRVCAAACTRFGRALRAAPKNLPKAACFLRVWRNRQTQGT